MASSTLTLQENDETTDVVFALVGSNSSGAAYKVAARSLNLPQTLDFNYAVGAPGAKGNDKLTITIRNSVENSTSGLVSTGSAKVILSVPRDSAWTDTDTADALHQLADLFTSARNVLISDALVP